MGQTKSHFMMLGTVHHVSPEAATIKTTQFVKRENVTIAVS